MKNKFIFFVVFNFFALNPVSGMDFKDFKEKFNECYEDKFMNAEVDEFITSIRNKAESGLNKLDITELFDTNDEIIDILCLVKNSCYQDVSFSQFIAMADKKKVIALVADIIIGRRKSDREFLAQFKR